MSNYLIEVPDIGEGIAEVEVVEWNVAIGGTIEEDDVLCVVMTDKATVEIPSPVDGTVTWQACQAGDMIAVGADFVKLKVESNAANYDESTVTTSDEVIIKVKDVIEPAPVAEDLTKEQDANSVGSLPGNYYIDVPDIGEGNISELSAEITSNSKVEAPVAVHIKTAATTAPIVAATETKPAKAAFEKPNNSKAAPKANNDIKTVGGAPRAEGDKPIAAPAVRQRAMNAGINLNYVRGTGPADRITHDDLDAFISGQSMAVAPSASSTPIANESIEEIKVIGLRRKIASIMQDTMQRIPHFTYVEEIDVTELEKLRAKLNKERTDEQPKLTMLPFFIKALVIAFKDYPQMSARFDDDDNIVYRYGAAHVGIATQTDNGLVVPVIKHAETLDLWQSANEVKRLSSTARSGKAKREELSGSTITITSLGPMGGIVTTPVINSPEVAIIGINKMAKRPVWQDGGFVPRDIMNISSSFDHRVIDGWEATLFVQRIKSLLESPVTLFM